MSPSLCDFVVRDDSGGCAEGGLAGDDCDS